MSEARTETTEERTAETAAEHGRHRGMPSDDTEAPQPGPGHGKHRRPTPETSGR